MLAKLLKYEFKSTSRVVLILYAVLMAVAVLLGLLMRSTGIWTGGSELGLFDSEGAGRAMSIVLVSLFVIYWALIMSVMIITMITIVVRFYRNLLGGEGYLMHTLPVKTHTLIDSKLITAFAWMLITYLAIIVSAFILAMISGLLPSILREIGWAELFSKIQMFFGDVNLPLWILVMILGTFSGILVFYFSMAIGNLANEHKILFSVLTYIGINIVLSFVTGVFSIGSVLSPGAAEQLGSLLTSIYWQSLVLDIIMAVGFYIGTNLILKKRLNLA